LPALLRTAETSKDLSIVRESVRTLLLLTPDPAPYLAEIKSARAPNELFAIADLMQGT
jgi:hypothetical protein